jgi:hypothetical protein
MGKAEFESIEAHRVVAYRVRTGARRDKAEEKHENQEKKGFI